MSKQLTILLANDHPFMREAWSFMLNSDPRFRVIAETGNGKEAVELALKNRPDIVILDVDLRDMNGIETAYTISQCCPNCKVLGASMHTQPDHARRMIKKGAKGFITKNSTRQEMFKAVIEVYEGRSYICGEIQKTLVQIMMTKKGDRVGIDSLSERELEVIEYIKKGYSSREIGGALYISPKTVEVHRYNIMKRLQLKNAAALVNYFNSTQLSV